MPLDCVQGKQQNLEYHATLLALSSSAGKQTHLSNLYSRVGPGLV